MCIFSDGKEIYVFDSLSLFKHLTKHMALQLAQIYSVPPTHSVLKIKRESVQQQANDVDCGVFAIAFAMEVCFGRNPKMVRLDQGKMRQHLYDCLSRHELSPFPTMQSEETLPRPTDLTILLKVYCVCKMPAQFDTTMVSCDKCQQWFHCSCVHIFGDVPEYWECPKCAA